MSISEKIRIFASMRTIVIVILQVLITVSMMAIPARREAVRITQPDGSTVTILLHGDEWRHFRTTLDGYTIVKNARGFYVYAEKKDGQLQPTALLAHDEMERTTSEQAYLADVRKYLAPEMSEQTAAMYLSVRKQQHEALAHNRTRVRRATSPVNFKGLIILIEYNDRHFLRDDYKEIVTDMVNKEGYTGYDDEVFTGSVCDYFSDNSAGMFKPQFDIVGPYTIDYSQYAPETSKNMGGITNAAIDAADEDVDFSQYDFDGDGYVDLIFFIFAGYGSNLSDNDERLLWPHMSTIMGPDQQLRKCDGVTLAKYACSTELASSMKYPESAIIDGIGTICHEFSHVLGLPDFYDVDYMNSGGQSRHPDDWSVMSGGSYYNNGRTPVGYSLYERYSLGFADEPTVIDSMRQYTLEPLCNSRKGYRLNTSNENEFFLFENRQQELFKWDTYLPGNGMLVHRVELNPQIWNSNAVNVNPKHNYYELLRAGGYQGYASPSDAFPGLENVQKLGNNTSPANLLSWAGEANEYGIANITLDSITKNITFTVDNYEFRSLSINEHPSIGVGLTCQLTTSYSSPLAQFKLTWTSSDKTVATVDEHGLVKGVGIGSCTITAKSDKGLDASCEVTVEETPECTIGEFKQQSLGKYVKLRLTDAEVLFVYEKDNIQTAYLRDKTGAIMLYDTNLPVFTDDILNGTIYVKTGQSNKITQAIGLGSNTNAKALDIMGGVGAKPREVYLDDLTEADYCDLVMVKAAFLETGDEVWAFSDHNRVRLETRNFGIDIELPSPADAEGKYYNIKGIYTTGLKDGSIINELNLVEPVEQVEAPSGISELHDSTSRPAPTYNLSGQRVGKHFKGLVIRSRKKILNLF